MSGLIGRFDFTLAQKGEEKTSNILNHNYHDAYNINIFSIIILPKPSNRNKLIRPIIFSVKLT